MKKQFVSGTRIFINENLTLKNKHLAFNCRQLKKGTIYSAHLRRNAIVYNKQNENSRPVVIQNMNALHDMFPNFYDLSKGGNENRDIRRPKCFCFVIMLNLIRAALLHL